MSTLHTFRVVPCRTFPLARRKFELCSRPSVETGGAKRNTRTNRTLRSVLAIPPNPHTVTVSEEEKNEQPTTKALENPFSPAIGKSDPRIFSS